MERICVYPGSFDPVTVGHMDIIRRSAALFDRVIVAVLQYPVERGCFALEDRLAMIRDACAAIPQVQVDKLDGCRWITAGNAVRRWWSAGSGRSATLKASSRWRRSITRFCPRWKHCS